MNTGWVAFSKTISTCVALSVAERHFTAEPRRMQLPEQKQWVISLSFIHSIHSLGPNSKQKCLHFYMVQLNFVPFLVASPVSTAKLWLAGNMAKIIVPRKYTFLALVIRGLRPYYFLMPLNQSYSRSVYRLCFNMMKKKRETYTVILPSVTLLNVTTHHEQVVSMSLRPLISSKHSADKN